MKPKLFKEHNKIINKPNDMLHDECGALPVKTGEGQLISCWQMNLQERLMALVHGNLWLGIRSSAHPVVWLSTEKNPITEELEPVAYNINIEGNKLKLEIELPDTAAEEIYKLIEDGQKNNSDNV